MELFIGLVFDPNSVHFSKIESFKKRYDTKFNFNPTIQLTLLPPFEIDFLNPTQFNKFKNDLTDIIDDHLFGNAELGQVEFNGINFFMGKNTILGLTPKAFFDLDHLKESLFYFLKDEGAKFKKYKESSNLILPIGRFDYNDQLEFAIEMAKVEFSSPFVLNTSSMALFTRQNYTWIMQDNLFNFSQSNNLNFVNNLWAN